MHPQHSQIEVIEDQVVFVRHLVELDGRGIHDAFDQLERACEKWPETYVIVEFPALFDTTAETRAAVKLRFQKIRPRINHLAMITPKNLGLELAFRLMALMTGFRNYKIYDSRDGALNAIREMKAHQ